MNRYCKCGGRILPTHSIWECTPKGQVKTAQEFKCQSCDKMYSQRVRISAEGKRRLASKEDK